MPKKITGIKRNNEGIKDLSNSILQVFINNNSKSFNYKQIAAKLNITEAKGRNEIIKKIAELKAHNRIEEIERGKYILVPEVNYYTGTLEVTANGNGYVICDELEHDIYIPSRNINKALNGDIVKVYIYKRKKDRKQEGEIVEIIERIKNEFVGVLEVHENFGFVVADDPKMYTDIFISKDNLGSGTDGHKVLVKIIDWPNNSKNPFGKILEVLGKPGDHQTEMHSILIEYGLPYKFPEEVERYASVLPIEIKKED